MSWRAMPRRFKFPEKTISEQIRGEGESSVCQRERVPLGIMRCAAEINPQLKTGRAMVVGLSNLRTILKI